jgi:selenocysteine lyase/cysteine desulfurase
VFARGLEWPDWQQGALRVCVHIFNTHDEVEKLLQGLDRALKL